MINLIQTYDSSKKIINANFSIEIDEINNIGDENIPIFKKLLQPKYGDFGIYVFTLENGSISLEKYPKDIEMEYELEKINNNSSYCNSPNALFISGGFFEEEKMTNFWVIDNKIYSIIKNDMIFPKSNHSMIYINHKENELIFFVGGDDLKTFYYDIRNNNFVNWGDMNGIHFRPGLIKLGEYLYCFHLIKDDNEQIFFERTNLNEQNHSWEKVFPNFSSEEFKNIIIDSEFGLSICSGGRVILWGGNFNNTNSYFYDMNKNLFFINEKNNNQFIPLIDKSFYKINRSHNITLPASLQRHVEIVIFNKIKYTLRRIHLSKEKKIKIKFKKIYIKNSVIGKVLLEFKTEDVNQYHNDINENGPNKDNNSIPITDTNNSNNISYMNKLPTKPYGNTKISEKSENENKIQKINFFYFLIYKY